MFIIVEYSAICKVIENPIIKYRTRMKEVIHLFTYAPLWQTLKDKGISQYELIKTYHISTGTLDALRKNKSVTMNTRKRQIASTVTFSGGCFAATDI